MRYDFVSLRLFIAIAECCNLTRAAEREHLAVSAVSKRVAELEEEVGTPLLIRKARGVSLTPAGQSLLHYAKRVFLLLEQLNAELGDYAGGVKGHIRIHAVASALIQFLPVDLQTFLEQYPRIQFDIEEATGKGVVEAVLDGSADVGVVSAATPTPGLTSYPYRSDRLMIGVPQGHPLAKRERIKFKAAAGYPFIGPHNDSSLSQLMKKAAQDLGMTLNQRVRASSFDAMCRMVSAGLGIVLLPEDVLSPQVANGRLKMVALDEPWAERRMDVVVKDGDVLPPLVATFLQHLVPFNAALAP